MWKEPKVMQILNVLDISNLKYTVPFMLGFNIYSLSLVGQSPKTCKFLAMSHFSGGHGNSVSRARDFWSGGCGFKLRLRSPLVGSVSV